MKKLFIILILGVVIYILTTMLMQQISGFRNNALVFLSNSEESEVRHMVYKHVNETRMRGEQQLDDDARIEIMHANVNNDSREDVIALIKSDQTCGTGGCMVIIMLQNDTNNFSPISFEYVVKEIDVENSLTNEMHDLRINSENLLKWDGKKYSHNSF